MTQRSRHVKPPVHIKALQAVVVAIGATVGSWAQAFTLGHARVVSAPGAPMQVIVPLLSVRPEEAASLRVMLAEEASWQRAGLQPPTSLASTVVQLQNGPTPTDRTLRIESTEAPASTLVDLLLDVASNLGQRQIQISIFIPTRGTARPVTAPVVGTPKRQGAAGGAVYVRNGDTLSGIAQRNAVPDATLYQMVVALWLANPQAFIQNNMNLVRAGESLNLPDAATVQAIDPAEARRIFSEQGEAYARYRGKVAAAAAAAPALAASTAASGKVAASGQSAETPKSNGQDHLRVSRGQLKDGKDPTVQADARVATERAMAEAQGRVNELENNMRVLNKAAHQSGQAAPASGRGTTASPEQSAPEAQAGNSYDGADTDASKQESGAAPAGVARLADASGVSTASDEPNDSALDKASLASLQAPDREASMLPAGWPKNLPVVIIVAIALVAFIIAWLLRRVSARRHQRNAAYDAPVNTAFNARLNERLDDIDLNLDSPSADAPQPSHAGPKA